MVTVTEVCQAQELPMKPYFETCTLGLRIVIQPPISSTTLCFETEQKLDEPNIDLVKVLFCSFLTLNLPVTMSSCWCVSGFARKEEVYHSTLAKFCAKKKENVPTPSSSSFSSRISTRREAMCSACKETKS